MIVKKLSRGIVIVLGANIINMIFGLLTGFIMPKHLSVDTYAKIKTFQLYLSCVGIFHLGYSDGMYLRCGGKDLNDIDKKQLSLSISTMRNFQLVVAIVLFLLVSIIDNYILMLFAIDLFSYNLIDFFKRIYQAVGEYGKYAKITNYVTIFNFVFNMIFIWVVKTDNPYIYILGYLLVDIFIWVLLEISSKSIITKSMLFKFSYKELVQNIKGGILLLFGNFTSIILTSMDRWFTKVLLTTFDFAQYSFAVSVENFLNVIITPVTMTLYNYFCINLSKKTLEMVRKYIVIFSTVVVVAIFPIKFILEIYLDKYFSSLCVIVFLFASQMFYIIIKAIYVNLYKAQLQQKKYFFRVVIVVIVGFLFNITLYIFIHRKEAFAFGTLLSAIVWLIICQLDFPNNRISVKETVFLIVNFVCFIYVGLFLSSYIGLIIYVFVDVLSLILLMKIKVLELIYLVLSFVKKDN